MQPAATFLKLDRLASTNTYVKEHAASLPDCAVVYTPDQTAGRGWGSNRWEAEPGKNLSFTILYRPERLAPARQWLVSVCTALGIVDAVGELIDPRDVSVKWPNDIYVGERKLAGILIENSITGDRLEHTVIGVGLNVNQTRFISDAPNPVSLAQVARHEFDLDSLLTAVVSQILTRLDSAVHDDALALDFERQFASRLFRNDGKPHRWLTVQGTPFTATVAGVNSLGELILRHDDDTEHTYGFKQVKHVINNNLTL